MTPPAAPRRLDLGTPAREGEFWFVLENSVFLKAPRPGQAYKERQGDREREKKREREKRRDKETATGNRSSPNNRPPGHGHGPPPRA